ncbi:MAG: hypothetical protein SO135_05625 [Sphaerochaetaceae bacterium]|jgi:hypothetical protein|nr:hypothetical protein [Sphaerochaetaceae bacterium]NLY07811.1 hypothetical protein [Spirochaetales bacterium]
MDNIKKASNFISEIATEITQALASRGAMDFYLGETVPERLLKLFRPVFIEVTCFAIWYTGKNPYHHDQISGIHDLSAEMGIEFDPLLKERIDCYEASSDPKSTFVLLCNYIGNNEKNSRGPIKPDDLNYKSNYQNKSELLVQLASENLESVFSSK